jgi:hypothetical protein
MRFLAATCGVVAPMTPRASPREAGLRPARAFLSALMIKLHPHEVSHPINVHSWTRKEKAVSTDP